MSRNRGRLAWAVAALAILLMASHAAEAQREGGRGRGGRGMFGRFGVSSVQLAAEVEGVQTALNMTDEQKQKAEEINDELREGRSDVWRQGDRDFRAAREEMEKLNQEASAKLAEVLDENQNKRLMGITVQVVGANALMDPAVAKELNVTDEQQMELRDAMRSNFQSMRDAREELEDLSRQERRAKERELREEADKNLMAVLTDEQKTKFEELKGEPVDIDMSELRGFGGRGGRDGRGGEGRRGGRGRDRGDDNAGQDSET